ncbi:hypothetical protein BN2476_970027 [Paraburkholderia piptadeniae]|uniref:Uncharacterized protein n=1 Tax=Paraburkholderia piptadeniae TaxID=1701573 RepID=A0A1N7SUH5_9BURK|nr:hypothetical protein [Paraburkholderia piptadeniae]SIT51015.1 hypothetical protein BN2476_970027 [Paraburkholderia piptadeniae]
MSTNLPPAPKVYPGELLALSNFIFRFLRVTQQATIDRTGLITLMTAALFIIFFALTWLLSTPVCVGTDVGSAGMTFHPRSALRHGPARSVVGWPFNTGIQVTAANLSRASQQVSANITRPGISVIRARCIYTNSPSINGIAASPNAVADLRFGAFSAFLRHMIVRHHPSRPTLVLPTSSRAAQWSSLLLEQMIMRFTIPRCLRRRDIMKLDNTPCWEVRFRSGEYIIVEADTAVDACNSDEVRKRQEYDADRFEVAAVQLDPVVASLRDPHLTAALLGKQNWR